MQFCITTLVATLALGVTAMPAQSEPAAMVNREVSSTELIQMMRDFKSSAAPEAQACDMDWYNTCRDSCPIAGGPCQGCAIGCIIGCCGSSGCC